MPSWPDRPRTENDHEDRETGVRLIDLLENQGDIDFYPGDEEDEEKAKKSNGGRNKDTKADKNSRMRKRISNNQGPLGKFWIFPVSAFSHAFSAEIQQGRVQNIGTNCHVSSGADPICTPKLFRLKVVRFLKTMMRVAQPHGNFEEEIVEFLRAKFDATGQVRELDEVAESLYPEFTAKMAKYYVLMEDERRGSYLAKWCQRGWISAELYWHVAELLRLLARAPHTEWRQTRDTLRRIEAILSRENYQKLDSFLQAASEKVLEMRRDCEL